MTSTPHCPEFGSVFLNKKTTSPPTSKQRGFKLVLAAAQDWIKEHKERGIQPVFANPSRQVVRLMRAAGLHDLIGEEFITVRMNDAVLLCQVRAPPPWSASCGGATPCGRELHVCLHKAAKLGDAQFAGASWQPAWEVH